MNKRILLGVLIGIVMVTFIIGAACGPKKELPPKDKIIIGQAASLSGLLSGEYTYACAPVYDLWVKDVNAAGGIYVKEYGKKLPVELKVYDDKSDIGTMTRLLEKLITEDKLDFVFAPWSTAFVFAAGDAVSYASDSSHCLYTGCWSRSPSSRTDPGSPSTRRAVRNPWRGP